MTEENTVLDFNDAINALTNASDSFKIDVWVPSKGKYVSFKEIDAKQQKSLLSAAIDSSVYNVSFVRVIYDILRENVLNEDKSLIDELTISDKCFIAVALRSQISDKFSVKFDNDKTIDIELSSLISKFNQYKTPINEDLEIASGNIKLSVTIGLPSVSNELEYEENFAKTYKNVDGIKNNKDLQNIVSEAFIGELTKYIKVLTVNESKFDFDTMSFNQKVKIVEKIPSGLIQKILEKISIWKKDLDSALTITDGEDTKVISIDSLLFLS